MASARPDEPATGWRLAVRLGPRHSARMKKGAKLDQRLLLSQDSRSTQGQAGGGNRAITAHGAGDRMMRIDDVGSAGVCPNYGRRFQHADIQNLAADVTDGAGDQSAYVC